MSIPLLLSNSPVIFNTDSKLVLAAAHTFSVETALSITVAKDVTDELTVCYLSEGSAAWTIQVSLKGAVIPRTDMKGTVLGPERISRLTGHRSLAGIPGNFSGTSFLFALTTLHGTKTLITYSKAASAKSTTTVTQRKAVHAWLVEEVLRRESIIKSLHEKVEVHKKTYDSKTALRIELELKLKLIQSEERASLEEWIRTTALYDSAKSELNKTTSNMKIVKLDVETAKVTELSSTKSSKWSIHDTIKTELRVVDSCGNAKAVC